MAYLDDTGLAYFWGKIKAWANSVFALLGHTHPASDVTLMTGYSKPSVSSPIAASDTLNQAVGKLEAKADEALDDSGFVHTTGDETVAGEKTFTGPLARTPYASAIILRNLLATRGVVPSGDSLHWALIGCDASGAEFDASGDHGRSFTLSTAYGTASSNYRVISQLVVYDNVASSTARSVFGVGIDNDGIAYASAPSTSALRNNVTDIVTRGWIDLDTRIVHTSGAETVGGAKTFTSHVYIENSNPMLTEKATGYARGTSASASFYVNRLNVTDNNSLPLVAMYHRLDHSTNAHSVSLNCYKFNSTSNDDYISLAVGYDAEGYTYASCPSTSGHRTTGADIVTRDWIPRDTRIVHTTGAESISGSKTFNDPLYTTYIYRDVNTSSLAVCGGNSSYNGGFIFLYGKSHSTRPGEFLLYASLSSSDSKVLRGYPNGTLTWNGQNIQTTSDERLKTPISTVPDDVLDAWLDVEWGQFRYLEAVGEKGSSARLHLGLIAQQVDRAFSARGRDALAYGVLCHEKCPASEDGAAEDVWMVRYAEALSMEAACMRRENARLKARLAALEDRLAALELRLGSE